MFEGQPKGLYTLALANTGERFGYYTMLAIFTLFLQAKFGYTAAETSTIFGVFLALVYFMPVVGGILADKFGYGKMVTTGIVVMFIGYLLLALPFSTALMMFFSLFLISCGTGLFKGNLQVMVGNLYDSPQYASKRDTAFSIFYMAINIGALFAPTAANKVAGYFLGKVGLSYDPDIPNLANAIIHNVDDIKVKQLASLSDLAQKQGLDASQLESLNNFCSTYVSVPELADAPAKRLAEYVGGVDFTAMIQPLADFSTNYLNHLSESYHYGFGVACLSLIVSMLIYVLGKNTYKGAESSVSAKAESTATAVHVEESLDKDQTKQRVVALVLVFAVVIFFWMSFHQNGLTMTFFARDYTAKTVTGLSTILFNVLNLALIIVAFYSLFSLFQSKHRKGKLVSALLIVLSVAGVFLIYSGMDKTMKIGPELFQQFNPFFVVLLTPVSLAVFGALAKRGKEPSAPRKIGIGMVIAALGFLVLAIGSMGLPTPEVAGNVETASWTAAQWGDFFAKYTPLASASGDVSFVAESFARVSPNWLISTYLILTFAELMLSPMGISFVSKVAPPKYKGLMMGGWFAATAIGNYLVAIIGYLWGHMPLWAMWGVLIVCCLLSALFIFSVMKRLEKVA